jgi:Arc/MetJ-type ribon-helix-helix transcriptional regulator
VKLSISLTEGDLSALDALARTYALPSRSAAVQQAIRQARAALDHRQLEDDYAAAFDEWESSGEAGAWAVTFGDGQADAAR